MELAVIAGTPFDAGLGAELLRAKGFPATAHPMAASPNEQDALQYRSPELLRAAFTDLLADLAAEGRTVAMLFCNSLSAVVEHDVAARPLMLISPVTVYREAAATYRRPLVVTGNGTAIVGYERTVARVSSSHRALGVADPALVRAIENGELSAVFRASTLPATLRFAEQAGLDSVVLGCTHFTAVLPYVEQHCALPVVDVGTRLVELTTAAAARQRDGRAA
jgi:glutamate racemase